MVALSSFVIIVSVQAQEESRYGSIAGSVFDSATKDSIPLATVVILGSTLGAATNDAGAFNIAKVPAGTYEVRASAVGYATMIRREVVVQAGSKVYVSFPLAKQSVQVAEVLVTGQQTVTPNLPVSTQYLTYKEIRNTAGAFDDLIRTVSALPGVSQSRADRNDLIVRGGAATENLFLIDNIEVPNIDHFGTQGSSGGSMSFVNLEFVEQTSFSAGGFGVRYGDKLSSVLSIGIREGRSDQNPGKAALSATQFGLNLEGPVSTGGSYLISVRRSYLDPVFRYYGFAFTPYFWDFLGKTSYQMGADDKVEILGIGAIDKIRLFDDTQDHQNTNRRQLFCNQNEAVEGVTWRHGFETGYSLVTLRHSYADFNYLQSGNTDKSRYVSSISHEREALLRADADFQVTTSTEVSAGIEGRLPTIDNTIVTTVITTGYINDPLIIPVDYSSDTTGLKGAAYAQISQAIGNLTVSAGVRGDYFDLIKTKSTIGTRFSVSYALTPVTKINASGGRYAQAPSYVWLMTNPYNQGLTYLKVDQYVVGVEHYIRSDTKISLEAYEKEYFDYPVSLTRPYIVMVNTGTEVSEAAEAYTAFGLDFLQSSGTGYAHGLDLFVEKRLSEIPFYCRLALSYGETRFTALDGVSRPSTNDQRWRLNIGGGYLIDEHWEVTSSFRLFTGHPYTPYKEEKWERVRSDYNSVRVGINHSLDVRVARRWIFDTRILNAYVDIQNVYNRKQRVPPSWNSAKNLWEDPPSIGIVPSVGVSLEF